MTNLNVIHDLFFLSGPSDRNSSNGCRRKNMYCIYSVDKVYYLCAAEQYYYRLWLKSCRLGKFWAKAVRFDLGVCGSESAYHRSFMQTSQTHFLTAKHRLPAVDFRLPSELIAFALSPRSHSVSISSYRHGNWDQEH